MSETPRRTIERTAHSLTVLHAAFGTVVDHESVQTIADVGAGDSQLAASLTAAGKSALRIDQDYAFDPPEGDNWHAFDACKLPLENAQFDATVSSYMLQHLKSEQQRQAIAEMLRITKPASQDQPGYVGLFPFYGGEKFRSLLKDHQLDTTVRIESLQGKSTGNIAARKLLRHPTLWIMNDPERRDDIAKLTDTLVEQKAFNKKQNIIGRLGQASCRNMMKASGSNRRQTRA